MDSRIKMQVSTEGIKETIEKIIEAVIQAIKKVIAFFKKVWIKIKAFFNIYNKKLNELRKEFSCIPTKDNLELTKEYMEKIYDSHPLLFNSELISINKYISNQIKFLLDETTVMFSPLDFKYNHKGINEIKWSTNYTITKNAISKVIKNSGLIQYHEMLKHITKLTKDNVRCVITNKKLHISKYLNIENVNEVFKDILNKEMYLSETKTTICKKDMLDVINHLIKLSNDLNAKFVNASTIHDTLLKELDNYSNDTDHGKDEDREERIKSIKYFGVNCFVDITSGVIEMLKTNIKISSIILDGMKKANERYTKPYEDVILWLEKSGTNDGKLLYFNNNKNMPYVYSKDMMEHYRLHGYAGAFVIMSDPTMDDDFKAKIGRVPAYDIVIFMDLKFLQSGPNDKFSIMDTMTGGTFEIAGMHLTDKEVEFVYWHEIGHIVLQNREGPQGFLWNTTEVYNERIQDPIKFYLKSYIELQADTYAMLKTGLSLSQTAMLRCEKLMPTMREFKDQYIKGIKHHISYVRDNMPLTSFEKLKSVVLQGGLGNKDDHKTRMKYNTNSAPALLFEK